MHIKFFIPVNVQNNNNHNDKLSKMSGVLSELLFCTVMMRTFSYDWLKARLYAAVCIPSVIIDSGLKLNDSSIQSIRSADQAWSGLSYPNTNFNW